ncbi:MAG: recombinase family protein, partial [Planctomycetia bacterium]|nr:recombinase family protein [Planctomycetia bacterium]
SVQVLEAITNSDLTSQVDRWQKITASADATSLSEVKRAIIELKKHATRFSQGTCVGRKPFGKRDGEQEILKRIWELRRKQRDGTGRLSYDAIAKRLNEDGEKPRQGKTWYAKTVQGIIKQTKPHLDRE